MFLIKFIVVALSFEYFAVRSNENAMQNAFSANGLSKDRRSSFMVAERTEFRLCVNISNSFDSAAIFGTI